ncbi:uncharacterized protein RCH25_049106 [Pelodytes ibericus]
MRRETKEGKASQANNLEIMNWVKKKELSIDEALNLSRQDSKLTEEDMKSKSLGYKDPASSTGQYNFTVYKHRYRWQKRILQVDFNTQMVFNIVKGTLKKKFPFTQIKSCKNNDGLKFIITFYGHQDYELEASCIEDKENLMKIMNDIIQNNGEASLVQFFERRHAQSEVILEGMLERQEQELDMETWVKYLVKLKRDEFIYYCAQEKLNPVKNSIKLFDCHVSSNSNNDSPTFTIKANGDNFVFRIPKNEQTKDSISSLNMRDKWVSVLLEYCGQNQSSDLHTYELLPSENVCENNHVEQPPPQEDIVTNSKLENSLTTCEDIKSCVGDSKLILHIPTNQEKISEPVASIPLSPTCIAPTAPPLPPTLQRALPNLQKRTKAFHWDKVPQEKINKSIWASLTVDPKKINTERIVFHFQCQDSVGSGDNSSDLSRNLNLLLNEKIAHNFGIILKSFHMEPVQLKDKLLIIHESVGGLSDEQLTNLRRYVPTIQDRNMYQHFKGSPSELHIVDQFMLEMCKIPDLCQRLDTILAIRELPTYMKDVQRLLSQKIKACDQLLKSKAFPAVLHYILAIGNCLNENAGKEKIMGFRLASLVKMSQLISKEKKFTLLHALVEQILLQEPDLAKFFQELTEFEAVPGASVKGLCAEVEVLAKELEMIDQYRKAFKNKHNKASVRESQFLKDLKHVVDTYGAEHMKLAKQSGEMKKIYSNVLQTFAEAEDQDSQELFGWISTFVKEFQNALYQNRQN